MELNIVNSDKTDFCEGVGITPERQNRLSILLDDMVRRSKTGPVRFEKMHDIFAEIASWCENPAELVYCTILHCGWNARQGRILAPGPIKWEVIALGIEMLYDRLRSDFTNDSQRILGKLRLSQDREKIKEGAREGVMRLWALQEYELAAQVINRLTGFAF